MNGKPSREITRHVMVYAAAILFAAATVHRFHWLGGPYFEIPDTIQDHVWPVRFPSADAIVLSRRVAPLLPRGAEVTIITPAQAPNYDQTHWLTGLGMLPRQHAVPPKLSGSTCEDLTDYVVTIGSPLDHRGYRQLAQFPEGYLYGCGR